MFDIIGRHNSAVVYANRIDPASYAQVLQMCNLPELKDSRIRMMPDMHASEGCTVGTSLTIGDRVNPYRYVMLALLLTGGIKKPEDAEALLQSGICDLVGGGRAMRRCPDWTARAWDEMESKQNH